LLSLTGGTLLPSFGGCFGGDVPNPSNAGDSPTENRTEPPEYDCKEANRPEPDTPDDDDAIRPATYPGRPGSLNDDERVIEYAKAYEEAYRRNTLVSKYWDQLVRFNVSVSETWTYDGPDDAAVVRLQYRYSEEVETSDGIMVGDSATIFVSYYVDPSVVIRAERTGLRTDESELHPDEALDPDPWKRGEPLECFE
jgi:hypothetical protein